MTSQLKVDRISPATGGEVIIDGFSAGGNTPAFFVTKASADQSVSSGVLTKVTFDTKELDTDSAFDLANNKFTVPVGKAGKYLLNGNISGHSTGYNLRSVTLFFYINGSQKEFWKSIFEGVSTNVTREQTVSGTVIAELAEGDYVELYGVCVSDNVTNLSFKHQRTYFSGFKLVE